jgi:DNA-binding transcriptional LysR family regulator
MIDLRTLEVFYWVAQLGGFGRAAAKLNTTQPAVSARIAALEEEYGVRLLVRDPGQRPALTPIGVALFDQARRMLALQAETVAILSPSGGLRGVVRIGVSETLVHVLMSDLLRQLAAQHPHLAPDVMTDASSNLREALRVGELDLAFMLGPNSLTGAHSLPLCDFDLAWVASPALALGAEPLTRARIGDIPVLTYARNTQPYADLAAALKDDHSPAARIFPNSSLSTIIRMAREGAGVATLPADVIRDEVASGSLVVLSSTIALPKLSFLACWLDPGDGPPGRIAALAREILGHNPA